MTSARRAGSRRGSAGRAFGRVLLALLVFAIVLPLVLVVLALEAAPTLDRAVVLTPDHIARAKSILMGRYQANQRMGTVGTLFIRPDDADLAANYVVNRFARGSARVAVYDGGADVEVSIPVPVLPSLFLNVRATALERQPVPDVTGVRIGDLRVPDWLTALVRDGALRWVRNHPDYHVALDAVQQVRLLRWGVIATYKWQPDLSRRMRAAAMDPAERARLRHYHDRLVQLWRAPPRGPTAMLEMLTPLLRLAAERSAGSTAVEETRAAILMAALASVGKQADILIPDAKTWPQLTRRTVLLDGRDDFAKHFLVSAAIAAYAGTVVADAVGLYKEVEDSRGGSGFSFNDIAADRAGTRFGELATASEASARALQARVAAGLSDRDVIPETRDLPEFLPEAEFQRRFGGIGAPAYREMMDDIERRVAALPLYGAR